MRALTASLLVILCSCRSAGAQNSGFDQNNALIIAAVVAHNPIHSPRDVAGFFRGEKHILGGQSIAVPTDYTIASISYDGALNDKNPDE